MNSFAIRTIAFVLFAFAILLNREARGQETRGTVFIAPGGSSISGSTQRVYQVGGGAERLLEHGLGVSADGAAVIPGAGKVKNTVGIVAFDLNYHFKNVGAHTEPFAAGGYSLLFRDFTANMVNFGGGINYWFTQDRGFRLEFRDNVGSVPNGPFGPARAHYWAFRLGLNFR